MDYWKTKFMNGFIKTKFKNGLIKKQSLWIY